MYLGISSQDMNKFALRMVEGQDLSYIQGFTFELVVCLSFRWSKTKTDIYETMKPNEISDYINKLMFNIRLALFSDAAH